MPGSGSRLKLLKIGGSVLSDKTKPFHVRYGRLRGIAAEISRYLAETGDRLVVVHGGGSFGHFVALTHLEEKGGYDVEALAQISLAMNELGLLVADFLHSEGVPAVLMPTHAVWHEGGLIPGPVREVLEAGGVPVLYGDIVSLGGELRIVSGDEVMEQLAEKLPASEAFFATDVDGIYDRHPSEPGAVLVEHATPSQLLGVETGRGAGKFEVTGEMSSKLGAIVRIARMGLRVIVFNGLRPASFYKALRGELRPCTIVEPEGSS